MRALDPEVAELRQKVAGHEAECITLGLEIKALREDLTGEASGYEEMLSAKNGWADRARSAEAFLASQGYTRGEDGTWGKGAAMIAYADGRPDEPINADQAAAIGQEANEDWRETCVRLRAQLAALHEFLRARGYTKGADGTWGKMG